MAERIRGSAWMKIRERIMRRDSGVCQECQRHGRLTVATQVDHIIALHNDGTNDDDNLEAICDDCHEVKTAKDLGHKPVVTTGLDGWPTEDRLSGPVWRRKGYR